jgi:hypothetical protein
MPAMNATSTTTACALSTKGPPKAPGPFDSIDATGAPSAVAIE